MKRNLGLLLLLLLLLAPAAVRADWLALKNGGATETRGPWTIKGQTVVFKSVGGTLSSIRLDEVDVPASRQLSKNAEGDRGLIEIKSSPTEVLERSTSPSKDPFLLTTSTGELFLAERTYTFRKFPQSHVGEECVPSRLVGATSGVHWWLQTGTKVAKFRPVGLAWADVSRLQQLVPDGLVCFEPDAQIPSPEPAGNLAGYARLNDGRDIGLELLRLGAARLSDEAFSRRQDYQAAAH